MESRTLKQTDFAAAVNRSPPAISQAIKKGTLAVNDRKEIILDDPVTLKYLKRRGAELTPEGKIKVLNPVAKPAYTPSEHALSTKNRADLELKKLAAMAHGAELKNAQTEGRLVAREAMIRGVWGPLETFLIRLLSDGAKTIAARVYPIGRAGGTIEDAEVETRKQLTRFIRPLKDAIIRALKIEGDE